MKIAVILDYMGSCGKSPEEEFEDLKQRFGNIFAGANPVFYRAGYPAEFGKHGIQPGTDVVLYDFGGMMPGCDDLLSSNARSLIRWCQEHPQSLALVVSTFTYRQQFEYELDKLNLTLSNLVAFESEDDLPEWFMATIPTWKQGGKWQNQLIVLLTGIAWPVKFSISVLTKTLKTILPSTTRNSRK